MIPYVGAVIQFLRPTVVNAKPWAALIIAVQGPDIVNLVVWDDQGSESVKMTVKYVMPGDPIPAYDYAAPIVPPGTPSVAPTKAKP